MIEIWKDIQGYEGKYKASSMGNVLSLNFNQQKYEKIMTPTLFKNGYYRIDLSSNGKTELISLHRIIAKTFINNPENKPDVNHINGIKTDNRVDNLEWSTKSENRKHAYKTGLQKTTIVKGEDNGRSKLTQLQINEIRLNINQENTLSKC
jgi:hypothetical protein